MSRYQGCTRKLWKRPIVSAFTATATEEVKTDISCVLKLRDPNDSGIIYCATGKNVDTLYELLSGAGIPVTRYHAGMNNEDRKESQDDFIYDRSPVILSPRMHSEWESANPT